MSFVKLNTDLFLGKAELNRFERFLKNDGYVRYADMSIVRFGILNDEVNDAPFNNLKILAGGTPTTISLNAGFALDWSYNIINVPSNIIDVATIPNDNIDRYISIEYATTNIEVGTVDILANGTITGAGTLFTEVLRSQPNFASRIKFPNSILNPNEYEVVTVTNNTSALIAGNLQAETGVEYVVVGTFTPDKIIPAPQKDIFVYDSYALQISTVDISNGGTIFNLAKVRTDGVTMVVEDIREDYIETKGSYELKRIERLDNPLIGVEQITFNNTYSNRGSNMVRIGWGFTATAWSINLEAKKVFITAGRGGVWETPADAVTGQLNGWRCYFGGTGKWVYITQSTLVGSTIELTLRNVNSEDITAGALAGDIVVVPDADEILLEFIDDQAPNTKKTYLLPMEMGRADLEVNYSFVSFISDIETSYRYIHNNQATEAKTINDGDYLNENAFNDNGILTGLSTSLVVGGKFQLILHPNNFYTAKAWLTKDNFGGGAFQGRNEFQSGVGFALGTTRNVSLTAAPDNTPSLDISGNTDGNFFALTDTNFYGEVYAIKSDNIGTAIWINFEVKNDVVFKHNYTVTGAEGAAGFKKIYNQGGLDINLFAGDYVTVVEYNGIWYVMNIWRKDGALDSTQASTFPILGLDNKCFVFADNQLGTILQEIIDNFCSMTTGNAYAFRAQKTTDQPTTIIDNHIILFEDDTNTPYFDNGNDMYVDKYIVPKDGIKQKFILENFRLDNIGGGSIVNGHVRIRVNGVDIVSDIFNLSALTVEATRPSLVTSYLTLNEGDIVDVLFTYQSGSVAVKAGAVFSNSFE